MSFFSSEIASGRPQTQPQSQTPHDSTPLLELFLQHESNINDHLELCAKVRGQTPQSTISFFAISSMINQSQRFMEEIKKIKEEFLLHNTARPVRRSKSSRQPSATINGTVNGMKANTSSMNGEKAQKSIPNRDESLTAATQGPPRRRKRSRNSGDSLVSGSNTVEERTDFKRPKGLLGGPSAREGAPEEPEGVPSIELEDISTEVEARLKLREETRRKKLEKHRKRKRESIESAGGGAKAKKVKNS
ncbi:hypothetical protein H112_03984 [Trichophyton rubrum D6]|nr:uncharacterized protein TERG_05308 [Trichophyton rubrum CBS 118892]EZF23268.1 hypothetical protein H100_03991 [Trichophyton rubrum MR850]EZF42407.1 hypothetical protein H102_03977 [Trichophyton rubrum CBS 100081]EZF53005.1 hypothetical protein H103_03991 [Trichophyton rubrum CBS 288.86]EZF63543.1 hypothetical protein H104_03977 [Trichophyton rubrum CBS 289.86]EZF74316.1 hypothetical protein H105_04006 [Trichophyton soudanense CBS 452.61]EZF84905.1 hypothetical protein H110_03984 [Trichophy